MKLKTEKDVIEALGEPDAILPPDSPRRMMSDLWKCSDCGRLLEFDEPVTVPAACPHCGGIAFEKFERLVS